MKTPEQVLQECHIQQFGVSYPTEFGIEDFVINAIKSYHDQFTIEPSERERQIAIEFAIYCPDEQGGMGQIFDSFTQSDAYKSIPARSVEPAKTMPSRKEAKAWLLAEMDLDPYNEYHEIYIDTAMVMYDWLTSNLNNLK